MLFNKIINKNDIDKMFQTLAEEYKNLGGEKTLDIFLVGGASIMLSFNFRKSTYDIDAYFSNNQILEKAIENTANKLNLSKDWLNKDFVNTPSFSYKLIDHAKTYGIYDSILHVYTFDPKILIAMKLKSSRPTGGDLDDILMMIYELRYKNIHITKEETISSYL